MTVARKASPQPMAMILRRFLSTLMREDISGEERMSSEVMSRIMAVMASHWPMSVMFRGICMFICFDLCAG